MPALETCQYELKEARQEILKLNKTITQRDVLVSDVLRENLELKQKLDEMTVHMWTRSHLEELMSFFLIKEVD